MFEKSVLTFKSDGYSMTCMLWYLEQVVIPMGNIGTINPVIMRENPSEKYIQIVTVDGHDFWFMGFVNFEKAVDHLLSSTSEFRAHENAARPVLTAGS